MSRVPFDGGCSGAKHGDSVGVLIKGLNSFKGIKQGLYRGAYERAKLL